MTTQHMPHFIVVKPTKSVGISILLTTLFGPIGLFYASVTGGLIMTFTPIVLVVLLLKGLLGGDEALFAAASGLLIIFILTYWLICTIWGAIAVIDYNKSIMQEAQQQQIRQQIHQAAYEQPAQQTTSTPQKSETLVSSKSRPPMGDWLKQNPGRTINDYYIQFGNEQPQPKTYQAATTTSYSSQPQKSSNSGLLTGVIVGLIAIIAILLFIMYDNQTNSFQISKLTGLVDTNAKEKEEIKNQIERTYFGVMNGAYTSQSLVGIGADELPFYNQNLTTLFSMGLMPLATFTGALKLEPKDIIVESIASDSALVKYNLVLTTDDEKRTATILMTVKKIGGHWKLDGEKFLPADDDKTKRKKK